MNTNILSAMITGVGGYILKIGLNLILIPVVIRFMGPENFGFYVFLFSLSEVILALDMGIILGLIQRLSHYTALKDDAEKQKQMAIGHWLLSMLSLAVFLIGVVSSSWLGHFFPLSQQQQSISGLVIALVILDAAINLYGCYYQALLKSNYLHKWINMSEVVQGAAFNVATIALLFSGFGLVEVFSAKVLVSLAINLSYAWHARQSEPTCFRIKKPASIQELKDIFSISSHSLLQRLCFLFSTQMDTLLIGKFLTMADVGIYGLVTRVFNYLLVICWKVIDAIFPVFTRLSSSDNKEKAQTLYLRANAFLCFMISLMLIVIMGMFPEIIQMLGSSKIPLDKAYALALVLAPSIWIGVTASVSTNYLLASGNPQLITRLNFVSAIFNFGMSFFLVQKVGFIGPALSTACITMIYHQIVTITLACKQLQLKRMLYINHVYIRNLPSILTALLGLYATRQLYATLGNNLIILAAGAAITSLLSALVWLALSTDFEKQILLNRLPVLRKFTEKFPLLALSGSQN